MSARAMVLGAIAAMGFASSGSAQSERPPLGYDLTVPQVAALSEYIYTRDELVVGSNRVLLVTRDFGSGLELRDAYLYFWTGDSWGMLAYRATNSSKVSMRVKAGALELVTRAGRTVLSLPVESIAPGYDPKEHPR